MVNLDSFTRSFLMLFVLFNPFLMSVYLGELVKTLPFREFSRQLRRATIISFLVFVGFALAGQQLFTNVLQVRFSAFLVFGGLTFLIIGIRLLGQASPVRVLEPGDPDVAASIAMPFMVGPGTISASVLTGARLEPVLAICAIALALCVAIASTLLFKLLHDWVRNRNERLVHRYTEVTGRAIGLFTGSFAIDMIFRGVEGWLGSV